MKKLAAAMLAAMMVLSLVACGDSGDSASSSNPPAISPAATIPPQSEEPLPSLEEIMYDISQYAENEDMQISEGASETISDMYVTGNTDAYLIFEYLCSVGLCTPKSNGGDITAGPILIQGSFQTGFTAAQMNLSTGELETVFSFYNNNRYSFAFDTTKQYYLNCYFSQQLFDEDLTKLAVSWYNQSNSSYHVGWVDRDGNLTDVSELIHPHTTDFSSKAPQDRYALFSPEGYFFFTDMNEECYCYFDTKTMSIAKREPVIVEHGRYYDTTVYNAVFMPDGSLTSVWHTDYSDAMGVSFGDYNITMPGPGSSANFKACDYVGDGVILCTGRIITYDELGYLQGYGNRCIAEVGKGISWPSISDNGIMRYRWEYPYSMHYLRLTPTTDYSLENCAYSNGRIAFIGSRGNERFLFTSDESVNENPKQIASISGSWNLLFWKGSAGKRNCVYLTSITPAIKDEKIHIEDEDYSNGRSYTGEKYSHYLYSNLEGSSVTWNLGGKYSKLTGLWTICYANREGTTSEAFEIYADGELVYTSPTITGGSEAVNVNVFINNCQELKITFSSGRGSGEFAYVRLYE